jgi:hypothetical protein
MAIKVVKEDEKKGKQEPKRAEEASMAVSEEEASISLEAAEPKSPRRLADVVECDMLLADVVVHSLTSETELNGRHGVCVDVKHISSGLMTKQLLVHLPEGREFWAKPENLTLVCSNAACRVNLLPPLLKCSQCKVAS